MADSISSSFILRCYYYKKCLINMEKENRFLKDFGKALLGLVPATRVGVSMFTPEAQEARKD